MTPSPNVIFSFQRQLSFDYLRAFWETEASNEAFAPLRQFAGEIVEGFAQRPHLLGVIEDPSLLQEDSEFIRMALSAVVPMSVESSEHFQAVIKPFDHNIIYATPALKVFMGRVERKEDEETQVRRKILHAYDIIFSQLYGLSLHLNLRMVVHFLDTESGHDRTFQTEFDKRFCKVKAKRKIDPLTDLQKREVLDNFYDLAWMEQHFPAEDYAFEGFVVMSTAEITEHETMSEINKILLDSDSIVSGEKFTRLERCFQSLLNLNDLRFSLAALREDEVMILNSGGEIHSECIFQNSIHVDREAFSGTLYHACVEQQKTRYVNDISSLPQLGPFEQEMLNMGLNSICVAPLIEHGVVLGTFGIKSSQKGVFNSTLIPKIERVLPLLTLAVKRSLEEFENRVQGFIQQQFTAIHPSVAWRFQLAGVNMMKQMQGRRMPEPEPIVFDSVYPLYAVSDIRGSSEHRNTAIQSDLVENLSAAADIIKKACAIKPLPVLDELLYRITLYKQGIEDGLDTGEEIRVVRFLNHEVEPCFADLRNYSAELGEKIQRYGGELNPESNVFYHKRKAFDDSVIKLNNCISEYIDSVQPDAQAMFPHYFDKQVTDGVDQTLYIGKSLAGSRDFDLLYLKNLRLWQLINLCEIARRGHAIKQELPVPLDLTHLIVVQDMPITITFNLDEKRFRVDGAYNIRYEIMKKRIDKAVIKDSGQRLTQPGQVAIVYSQRTEQEEYLQYIEYLLGKGFLHGDVEDVELESLQGINGLRALRVAIVLNESEQA